LAKDGYAQYDRIGASEKPMYGPRGMVVSGMTTEEQEAVCALVREGGMEHLPIIFVTDDILDKTLREVLGLENQSGKGEMSSTRRAIIMSGFLELELQLFMSAYRRAELPRPMWATLTPISKDWTLSKLLSELAAEDDAYST
jgi:hypothetical protein